MLKNKKLLLSFLASNLLLSGYNELKANTKPINTGYKKIYDSMKKNLDQGNSNKGNYKLIENILKQKNKELKDLVLQGEYIIKPEYLEWQWFTSGFYASNNSGDKEEYKIYDENGNETSMINPGLSSASGRDYRTRKMFQLGATIPVKRVDDFNIIPNLDLNINDISPLNIKIPVTKIEKFESIKLSSVTPPVSETPSLALSIEPEIDMDVPNINMSINAGHDSGPSANRDDGGAPTLYFYNNMSAKLVNNASNPFTLTRGIHMVVNPGYKFYLSNNTDYTITNSNAKVRYFIENYKNVKILANYGTVTIDENTSSIFIIGDDTENDNGSTTVYNSGTLNINAKNGASEYGTPSSVGIAYRRYNDGAAQKYLINSINGIINVNGWGNYGFLMDRVQNNVGNDYTNLSETQINILMNKGEVNLSVMGRPDGKTEGNVGIDAYTNSLFNDNSFILNNSTGRIVSKVGNNILMRHKGTGEIWNKGNLIINSSETVGLQREHWVNSSNGASKDKVVIAINDGAIVAEGKDTNNVESNKVIAIYGKISTNNVASNTSKAISIKNGDGVIDGTDYIGGTNAASSVTKDLSKGELGDGGISSYTGAISTPHMSHDPTQRDTDPNLDKIDGADTTNLTVDIYGKGYNYKTKDGVMFIGSRNSIGLMGELLNPAAIADYNRVKVANERDGKIFLYTANNNTDEFTVGMYGRYASVNNAGGIFLNIIPTNNSNLSGLATGIINLEKATENNNGNLIGIYAQGGKINNFGFITDLASDGVNYSKNSIGIFQKKENSTGDITNTGNITLGEGGKGIIGEGINRSDLLTLVTSGNITVNGSSSNMGVGIYGTKINSDLSGNINIYGENNAGIYLKDSIGNIHNININGTNITNSSEVNKSYGIAVESSSNANTSDLKFGNNIKISMKGENNIGIYGKTINLTDNILSTNKADHIDITLGSGGIGIYLYDLRNDSSIKINNVLIGNNTGSQESSGIALKSTTNKIVLDSGNIIIGSIEESGSGFGIYLDGKTNEDSTLKAGNVIVNQKSATGVYGNNVKDINVLDVKAGKTGIYHTNNGTAGSLTAKTITLIGNEDNMVGIYSSGTPDKVVEIKDLIMQTAGNKSTGVYVENGSFKTTGNIDVNSQNSSFGAYIKGGNTEKTVDFGSGTTNIKLGNDSIGIYLEGISGVSLVDNITIGDTTGQVGTQTGVGLYMKDSTMLNPINTNIVSGSKTIGAYFSTNTGNLTYNGNVKTGDNSLGVYKNGGTIARDASKSIIFTGLNNKGSIGYYLEDAKLNYTSNNLNADSLKMNEGIAFLLKGSNSKVLVNGVAITNADLDKLGLAPKVERFVYSDKDEIITENIIIDPSIRYYGHHAVNGRIELSGDIIAANDALTTYGILVQGRYTGGNEEVFISSGRTIDMTNSLGSTGIQALEGTRVVNEGLIKAGKVSNTSVGIGILGESIKDIYSNIIASKIENRGSIELLDSGIGIYLDSSDLGGDIINSGNIITNENNTLGIYSALSNSGVINIIPQATIINTGSLLLKDDSFGIFSENSNVLNTGNISVDNSINNNSVGIYASKNSKVSNNSGHMSIGSGSLGYYLDNSNLEITGGTFDVSKGILAYAFNESNINYNTAGTTLGDKIGFYLDNSTLNLNGKDFTLLDNGVGVYMTNTQLLEESMVGSLGKISLGNNGIGIYSKNNDILSKTINGQTYTLGGEIELLGSNSLGIMGVNANIDNTTTIKTTNNLNKGLVLKLDQGGVYSLKNTAQIDVLGSQSLGIYAGAKDEQGTLYGNIDVENTGVINIGSSSSIKEGSIGIYGTEGVNILNKGIISGGDYSVGIYSNGGYLRHESGINLQAGSVGLYISRGVADITTSASIEVGQGGAVGIYGNNGAKIVNESSNIVIGTGSIAGYAKDKGTEIVNKGSLALKEEGVGFYTNEGKIVNEGILNSLGDGIIYLYGNNGVIENKGEIKGRDHKYGVGVYGSKSEIKNEANIYLGDSYIPYPEEPSNKSNRFSVGIYGQESRIENNGNIEIGERGIGIYSYVQEGDIVNTGKISAGKNNVIGIFSEEGNRGKVINRGRIELTGDNVIGVALNKSSTLENEGYIIVDGKESIGVLADNKSKIINNGTISAKGANSVVVLLKGDSSLVNGPHGVIELGAGSLGVLTDESHLVTGDNVSSSPLSGSGIKLPSISALPTYNAPSIVNSGIIKVDGKFEVPYNGVVQVKVDPESIRGLTEEEKKEMSLNGENLDNVILISNGVRYEADGFDIKDVTITGDFTEGTNVLTYKLEKVFSGTGSSSGIGSVYSESYTWDAIPVNENGSVDVWMKKISYESLMEGYWFEDFGKALDKRYEGATGNGGLIFDKIDRIKTEQDFVTIMGALGGSIYANMNEREDNITKALESSLDILKSSENNTKENIKLEIIGGKGKNTYSQDGIVGYDYNMYGVLGLREVERTYRHKYAYSLGYLHSQFEFKDGMESEESANTFQLGGHSSYRANNWLLRNDVTGKISMYNIDRNIDWTNPYGRSEINGSYETYSVVSDNILGYDLELGKNVSIMPYGGVRGMYLRRPEFKEKGLEALEIEGDDFWSIKPKVGMELRGSIDLGKSKSWKLKSKLDISYEYELGEHKEKERAKLVELENSYHKLGELDEKKGRLKSKASIGIDLEDRYGIYLTGDYELKEQNKENYRFGINLKAVF